MSKNKNFHFLSKENHKGLKPSKEVARELIKSGSKETIFKKKKKNGK